MSAFPDSQVIEDIANELGTSAVFLEKDWHVSHIIRLLAHAENDTYKPIFCGGTSLLKGYQLINRFSEDVDFRILAKRKETTQNDRRAYRNALLQSITSTRWDPAQHSDKRAVGSTHIILHCHSEIWTVPRALVPEVSPTTPDSFPALGGFLLENAGFVPFK